MNTKSITRDVIAILIVLGAIVAVFLEVSLTGERLLQTLAGLVVGYYFGAGINPTIAVKAFGGAVKTKTKRIFKN